MRNGIKDGKTTNCQRHGFMSHFRECPYCEEGSRQRNIELKNDGGSAASVHGIVMRLRNYDDCHDGDIDEAADMLEFFLNQMQAHDVKMDGNHRYRFVSGGWPMTHCVGSNKEEAVDAAMREIERSRSESA